MRVFIDTMNETEMSLQSLVVEIRENIFPATINAGISAELEYDRKLDLNLPAVLFRDIKLCLYESVSNAMKYSSATRLKISLQKSGQGMEILLSDNGCLKDVRVLENKGGGIGNLRKRVEKYDGQVDFSIGAEGHGLEIRFRFPL